MNSNEPKPEVTIIALPGNQSMVPGMGSLPRFMPSVRASSAPRCPFCNDRMTREGKQFACYICKHTEPVA